MPQSFAQNTFINASADVVWSSLTQAELMKCWMGDSEMGIQIETDWTVGSPVVVRGFLHVPFENRGVVVAFQPTTRLAYTHLSSLSGLRDEPESYAMFDFRLESIGKATSLSLVVSGFPTEVIFKHLQLYWRGTLPTLKQQIEQNAKSQ